MMEPRDEWHALAQLLTNLITKYAITLEEKEKQQADASSPAIPAANCYNSSIALE